MVDDMGTGRSYEDRDRPDGSPGNASRLPDVARARAVEESMQRILLEGQEAARKITADFVERFEEDYKGIKSKAMRQSVRYDFSFDEEPNTPQPQRKKQTSFYARIISILHILGVH